MTVRENAPGSDHFLADSGERHPFHAEPNRVHLLTNVLAFYTICPIKMARQSTPPFWSWGGRLAVARAANRHTRRQACHTADARSTTAAIPATSRSAPCPVCPRSEPVASFRRCATRSRISANRHFRVVHFTVQTNHVHLLVESGRGIDRCSSGAWFGGRREPIEKPPGSAPVARPRTWLLRVGWRRSGPIGIDDSPASAR